MEMEMCRCSQNRVHPQTPRTHTRHTVAHTAHTLTCTYNHTCSHKACLISPRPCTYCLHTLGHRSKGMPNSHTSNPYTDTCAHTGLTHRHPNTWLTHMFTEQIQPAHTWHMHLHTHVHHINTCGSHSLQPGSRGSQCEFTNTHRPLSG